MKRGLLGGLLGVVVFATACGDDGGVSTSTTTTSSSSTTTIVATTTTTEAPTSTAPELTDEEQIVAIVERFYEIIVEANNPPDPGSQLWAEVATDEFGTALRDRASTQLDRRRGLRNPELDPSAVLKPRLITAEGGQAFLNICLRDDTIAYDLDTEEMLNDEVIFEWKQVALVNTDAGWRVSDINGVVDFESEDECVASYP